MIVELSVERGDLLLSPRVPEGFRKVKVPGAQPQYGMWGANKILLQSKSTEAGQVYDIHLVVTDANSLIAKYQQGVLLFHLSLEGSIEYTVEGLPPVLLHERQFTFYYVPFFLVHVLAGMSASRSVMICMDPTYLNNYGPRFAHIRAVMQKIKSSHAIAISDKHFLADYNLLARVAELQQVTDPKDSTAVAYEVLDMALEKMLFHAPPKNLKISRNTIEKFYAVRKIITANLQKENTLLELEQMTQLTNYELKKVFPLFFGVSTRTLLIEARMAYTECRVRQGEKIPSIAKSLGYSDESGLRRAFTKFFGMPPEEYRQRSPKTDQDSAFVAYRKSG